MITEDYVSFDTAKLLKEKGFNEKVICYYDDGGSLNSNKFVEFQCCNQGYGSGIFAAPTLQMTRRWLMAVHNLFITFELDFSDGAYPMFDAVVYNLATCEKYPIINYDRYSYIKGTEAAIKYCLENLI
jgi:hypothetical protein